MLNHERSSVYVDRDVIREFRESFGARHCSGDPLRPRIAIYSHDAQGLGHLRRNLLITRSFISAGLEPSVLMLSGLREAAAYEFPPGVDSITLPALAKDLNGAYTPRTLPMEIAQVMEIRQRIIAGAIDALRPDVFIVDKLPLGIFGELAPAISALRARPGSKIVLGLRDILDDAESVRDEWRRGEYTAAIREFYDEIWVYGDPRVCDVVREYALPIDIASKLRYVGYLNPRHLDNLPNCTQPQTAHTLTGTMDIPPGSLTLCLVGGGRDGFELAAAFLEADLPEGEGGVVVCGPLMDAEDRAHLRALAADRDEVRVIEFITDPQPLFCCADRVICMGGYNSLCEVLAFHKPALVVPRVSPRREQWIRASRFADMNLIEMLHPDDLDAAALTAWLHRRPHSGPNAEAKLDFQGVARLPHLLAALLEPGAVDAEGATRHG